MPEGAIIDTPAGRAALSGALIQHYVEPGAPMHVADVLRPRDRGFLAAVLAPGTARCRSPSTRSAGSAG